MWLNKETRVEITISNITIVCRGKCTNTCYITFLAWHSHFIWKDGGVKVSKSPLSEKLYGHVLTFHMLVRCTHPVIYHTYDIPFY
jgi:hypothetical protein